MTTKPPVPATVTLWCQTTDGDSGLHTVPVSAAHRLGCGCIRYRCDRPGTTPAVGGMEAHTGCSIHESDLPAMMTVRVADRRHSPVGHATIRTVTIAAICPVCGGPRGEPYNHNFADDGAYLSCDRWDNPCGHVDYYARVLAEVGL